MTLALEKHPCPACGAQAEWNPGKQKLVYSAGRIDRFQQRYAKKAAPKAATK